MPPSDVPVLFDHRTEIGRFTDFTLDGTGIRTIAEYDRSSLADALLAEMRSGRLAAYSVRLSFPTTAWDGEYTRAGVPVYSVPEAELLEAGPTYQLDDPHARVLSVGGQNLPDRPLSWADTDHFLDTMSAVTGVTAEQVRDEARLAGWVAQETVYRAERLGRAIAKASRTADLALSFWHRADGPQEREREYRDYLEANRTVRRCEAELRELLVNDTALIDSVLSRAGVGG